MNLDHTFAALADPTRRAILGRLAQGEATVGELRQPFAVSQPAISRHLKVLETARLITNERRGQHRVCRLAPGALHDAGAWLDHHRRFWDDALDRLDNHLNREKEP
jgi:DNA-binding transcriptional ArsR family regulator